MSTTDNAGGKPGSETNASGTPANGTDQQPQGEDTGGTPASFTDWLNKQDHATQELLETEFKAVRSTAQSERDARKKAEKELKALAKSAEQGSDLQKKLEEIGSNLGEQTARADFYEDAHKQRVTNLKYAWHLAKAENLIDGRGRVDWDEFRTQFPELFATAERRTVPPGNAGNGTREGPPKQVLSGNAAVNAAIRGALGR